jgi:hypothetical protein
MDEICNDRWYSLYQYIVIPIIAILLICGLIFFPYELAHHDVMEQLDLAKLGLVIGFTLSLGGSGVLIWWLIRQYIANKYWYSMDDVFPQSLICDQSPLNNE